MVWILPKLCASLRLASWTLKTTGIPSKLAFYWWFWRICRQTLRFLLNSANSPQNLSDFTTCPLNFKINFAKIFSDWLSSPLIFSYPTNPFSLYICPPPISLSFYKMVANIFLIIWVWVFFGLFVLVMSLSFHIWKIFEKKFGIFFLYLYTFPST